LTTVGITMSITAGQNVTAGQVLYPNADGKYYLSDADAASTMPVVAIATETKATNAACVVLAYGLYTVGTNWTIGGLIYASTTAGALTQTRPSGTGDQVQIVGYAYSATVIFINPNLAMVEIA